MRHPVLLIGLAVAMLVTPLAAAAQSTVEGVVGDIDAFWAQQFANAGLTYTSPHLVAVDTAMDTDCGPIDASMSPAADCAARHTTTRLPGRQTRREPRTCGGPS